MGIRLFTAILVALAIFIVFHKERHLHSKTIHRPVQAIQLSSTIDQRPFYAVGSYKDIPAPSMNILDALWRKKINSFIINHYNHYRCQITFIDIGYLSEFVIKVSSEVEGYYEHRQKIGFSLGQQFFNENMNIDFKKPYFKMKVQQYEDNTSNETITKFYISITSYKANFTANLIHTQRNSQCFTAVAQDGTTSHKCFGGTATGDIEMDRRVISDGDKMIISNAYKLSEKLTRVAFDGFRGSGMHWEWIRAQGFGFSKPQYYANNLTIEKNQYLALNFGSLNGQGQDIISINGKIRTLQGVSYLIDEDCEGQTNITFTAISPKLQATFVVVQKSIVKRDIGVAYIDMVVLYGLWKGYIEDQSGNEVGFYEIAGIIEASDSFF